MKILITGAAGFVGKNLTASLKNIKDGRDRTRPNLHIDEIYEYDIHTDPELLDVWCEKADFVFILGGLFYTGGVFFYLRKTKKFSHAVWHIFVLLGSFMHFFAVLFSCVIV